MQATISVFNDLFNGMSTNALTAFLNESWTAHAMFIVINVFFLIMIFSFMTSLSKNRVALRTQGYAWAPRVITGLLMPLIALAVAVWILLASIEFYEQLSATYSTAADKSLAHSSVLLLLTVIVFKKVSVHQGLRNGLSRFFSFRTPISPG